MNTKPTLEQLARDQGYIGQVLRRLPDWMLKEADRWCDPWQILRDSPVVSSEAKKVFRAAQSQGKALRRLAAIAQGRATFNTDWGDEYKKARAKGDKGRIEHCVKRISDAEWCYEDSRAETQNPDLDPEIRAEILRRGAKRNATLIHRGKRDEVRQGKSRPRGDTIRRNKLPGMLAEWWVRSGESGVPGLMFWRNAAISKLLNTLRSGTEATPSSLGSVKKTRQQLELIPVSDKTPWVWDVSVNRHCESGWEIKGKQRNGKEAFYFCGEIRFDKKPLIPLVRQTR